MSDGRANALPCPPLATPMAITTHFNFILISTAFDGGNVPAIAVQKLEVAA